VFLAVDFLRSIYRLVDIERGVIGTPASGHIPTSGPQLYRTIREYQTKKLFVLFRH